MLRNDGTSFADVSASLGPVFARPAPAVAPPFGDLDDDGDLDIVVANLDAEPTLLRNEGGNAGHWLTVALRGTRSNRQGIGAVVQVVDDARPYAVRHLARPRRAISRRAIARVHFGLGDAKTMRRVEVRWPSGALQVLTDVSADRVLDIVEPAAAAR